MLKTEVSLADDPKYKQYTNSVEKALRSFETSNEWADLISALGKLQKALNSKFKVIPKKVLVGKRLAQCMHPALPGGVHIKALDVYKAIFEILNRNDLINDLYIYSTGFFPIYVNASMQVRPILLNLIEKFLVPLDKSISVCINGLMFGLLPGLEDGSENFERLEAIFSKICNNIGKSEFYTSLWNCALSSSSARLSAIQFVTRNFDKKQPTAYQSFILGDNSELVILALSDAIQDSNILVQRAVLDFLIICFPFSANTVAKDKYSVLLVASLTCVLRRDMSLNRRLYTWLLGCDQTKLVSNPSIALRTRVREYFKKHSHQLLVESLNKLFFKQVNVLKSYYRTLNKITRLMVIEQLFPLKVLSSLLDKPEVGPYIIEDVFINVFRLLKIALEISNSWNQTTSNQPPSSATSRNNSNLKSSAQHETTPPRDELIKNIKLFFGFLEDGTVWKFLASQFNLIARWKGKSHNNQISIVNLEVMIPTLSDLCGFVTTLLKIISVDDNLEVQVIWLPVVCHSILNVLVERSKQLPGKQMKIALETCSLLLSHTQPVQQSTLKDEKKSEDFEVRTRALQELTSSHADLFDCNNLLQTFFVSFTQHYLNRSDDQKINDPSISAVFSVICQLIVDFSSFPVYQITTSRRHDHTSKLIKCSTPPPIRKSSDVDLVKRSRSKSQSPVRSPPLCSQLSSATNDLPSWIRSLLWCSCEYFDVSRSSGTFDIFATSVSTLIDFLSFPQNRLSTKTSNFVTTLSTFKHYHAKMVTYQTDFYQQSSRILWEVLGNPAFGSSHLCAVRLLTQAHSICPNLWCEDVILEELLSSDKMIRVSSVERFCRFWHLIRSCRSFKSSANPQIKTFSRCLFALVDHLSRGGGEESNVSVLGDICHSGIVDSSVMVNLWLRQCLDVQDLGRILEPYLQVLLQPATHSAPFNEKLFDLSSSLPDEVNKESYVKDQSCKVKSPESKDQNEQMPDTLWKEISRTKMGYRNLVSDLTRSSYEDVELFEAAEKIVDECINAGLQQLLKDSSQYSFDDEGAIEANPGSSGVGSLTSDSSMMSDLHLIREISSKGREIISHSFIYQEPFDTSQVVYCLRSILNLLQSQPRSFTYASATTHLSSTQLCTDSGYLQELLTRHEQSHRGISFYDNISKRLAPLMVVDVLVGICLHFIRSWPARELGCLTIDGAHEIRCVACQLLIALLTQLKFIANEKRSEIQTPIRPTSLLTNHLKPLSNNDLSKFAAYLCSILEKHLVAHNILLSLQATVLSLKQQNADKNVITLHRWWCGSTLRQVQSFQTLLLTIIQILLQIDQQNSTNQLSVASPVLPSFDDLFNFKYDHEHLLSQQPALAACLIEVFRCEDLRAIQPSWMEFLTSSLQSLTPQFSNLATPLISSICTNIEQVSSVYRFSPTNLLMTKQLGQMPAGYLVMMLKTLRLFINTLLPTYSTRKLNQGTSSISHNTTPSSWTNVFNVFGVPNKNYKGGDDIEVNPLAIQMQYAMLESLPCLLKCLSQVWNNIMMANNDNKSNQNDIHPSSIVGSVDIICSHLQQLLNPFVIQYGEHLMAAFAIIWEKQSRSFSPTNGASKEDMTAARISGSQDDLLRFATALTSLRCDEMIKLVKKVVLQPPTRPQTDGDCQTSLQVSLLQFTLGYLRLQSMSSLHESRSSIFSLVREYLSSQSSVQTPSPATTPDKKWESSPRSVFFLLLILSETVRRTPPVEDKKQQKELQEVCQRSVEACNAIVECSLEYGGWLARRVAAVVPESAESSSIKTSMSENGFSEAEKIFPSPTSSASLIELSADDDGYLYKDETRKNSNSTAHLLAGISTLNTNQNLIFELSVQAITVLSQVLANLLDLVFSNEEKDKIVPILTPVIANVTPYLKNRRAANTPAYLAAAKLLVSVCGYQQTRRSWKKEVSEIFLDASFFHMPLDCVSFWRTVIDHLMAHDTTTFKDLVGRINMVRSSTAASSLNIFSSKEQEHESRAAMLKRLAFVLFSSDINQFRSYLPEIHERLAESLRLHHVPAIQEQVFLCLRVLLLRVSSSHLASIWPTMLTELFQILIQIENEIKNNCLIDIEEQVSTDIFNKRSLHKSNSNQTSNGSIPSLTPSPTASSSSGKDLKSKKLALYLSVCKLLDLLLVLQPDKLSHFKLFRWSFVDDHLMSAESSDNPDDWLNNESQESAVLDSSNGFTPLCLRISQQLAHKNPTGSNSLLTVIPLRPLLTQRHITSLIQLQPYFNTISTPSALIRFHRRRFDGCKKSDDGERILNLVDVLTLLERDFAETLT